MAGENNLRILSYNVNGLADHHKMKDVFDYLRKQKAHILMLQETHFKTESQNYVRAVWGFDCILNGNSTNSKGVGIFFSNKFHYKVHSVVRANTGEYLIVDIEFLGKRFTLVNVYGPSDSDSPSFFRGLMDKIDEFPNENLVIGGDWNVVLDMKKDSFRYTGRSRPNARVVLHDMISSYDLVDVWRELHPNAKQYSWRRFNSMVQGRLDFFLVSDHLMPNIKSAVIGQSYRSDHKIVMLDFKVDGNKRQRSFWKFNNSLLRDKRYVEEVKQVILDLKIQYGNLLYDRQNINNVSNELFDFIINDQLFF